MAMTCCRCGDEIPYGAIPPLIHTVASVRLMCWKCYLDERPIRRRLYPAKEAR